MLQTTLSPTHPPPEEVAGRLPLIGGRLCLDFCNTAELRETDRPLEFLQSPYSVLRWAAHAGMDTAEPSDGQLESQLENLLENARTLREAIYNLFVGHMRREPDRIAEALPIFNAMLHEAHTHRLLIQAGDAETGDSKTELRFEWRWSQPASPRRVLWAVALSAAEILDSPDVERVRQCPGCGWLFVDQSRNRSRTWCDMQFCGNRAKAKRHYQRVKGGG
jgi:predicted RNA-binding Zn ribbon-like protein